MAYQVINGQANGSVPPYHIALAPSFTATTGITATGDKLFMAGRYWNSARAAKSIRRICFEWGTITKAGGSALTLSLQDVDLVNGPTMRPDETQDQTVAVANADAAFASNTWYRSGTLSADRSVTPGDYLAFVCEYDGGGRLGADSVTIRGLSAAGAASAILQIGTKIGGSFAGTGSTLPNIVFEHSDGTFGTFMGSWPVKTINAHTFKQDTAGSDEYALAFQVPFPCQCDGMWIAVLFTANTSDFSVVVYDGTSAMETIAIDANAIRGSAGAAQYLWVPFTQLLTFSANHQYYVSAKPTQTTNTIAVYSFDVDDANHFSCHPGGPNFDYTTRLDLGAWAAITTTRRLLAGLSIVAFDDATGGGGGLTAPIIATDGGPIIRGVA